MISCQAFRADLQSQSPAALEHLRKCDACLDYAVRVDPDTFFRAIGGDELIPPGGVDAFASDVMAQIRMRQTEGSVTKRFVVAPRRLAAAAAIVLAIGAGLVYETQRRSPAISTAAVAGRIAGAPHILATKPVVETYDSKNATIVEVPREAKNDPQVVMIFDESLPADL
jgi:hypothetical protein